jgi:serine phosphatase RsbU (regulator of sigma subunit)
MVTLDVLEGPEAGRRFPVDEECVVIGRAADASICLPSHVVSRHHAKIVVRDGQFFIEDMGSYNGTFVNGQRLTGRTVLTQQDQVRICEFVLILRTESEPAEVGTLIQERVSAATSNPELYAENPGQKLQTLLELGQHLGQALELQPLLDKLLDYLLWLFPLADRGMVVLCEGDRLTVRGQRSRRRGDADFRFSRTLLHKALREGTGILSEDVRQDGRLEGTDSLAGSEVRSLVCVPLLGRGGARLGVVQLDAMQGDRAFGAEHLRLLTVVGLQVAMVLENMALNLVRLREEGLRRELAVGREIQLGFLPTDFDAPPGVRYELFASLHPAREVSGDLYDFFTLPGGRLALALGDVSDKGIPAALFMVKVQTLLRHLAPLTAGPAETLARLNDALATNNPSSMFVTLAHAVYDPGTSEVVLASAGHPPPLRRSPDGLVEEWNLPSSGRLLGCFEGDPGARDARLTLNPGETLVLYSDGYTEAAVADRLRMFGVDRLAAVLGGPNTSLPLAACAEQARTAVERFTGSAEQQDDLTLLLLRRPADGG